MYLLRKCWVIMLFFIFCGVLPGFSESLPVNFGATKLMIPDTYLPGITPFNIEKNYAALTIGVLLPDFKPAAQDKEEFNRTGWYNQLRALFEYGLHFRNAEDLITQDLSWGNIDKRSFNQLANGCHFYKGNMTVANELYVCDGSDKVFMFTCSGVDEVPSPSCRVMENIDDNTTVIYSFSRGFLIQDPELDTKVRNLFRSFIIK